MYNQEFTAYDALGFLPMAGYGLGRLRSMRAGADSATTTVIGKLKDLESLAPHENTLLKHLPDLGNFKLNWKQNSSVLRREIRKGKPIRDASVSPNGERISYPGSFTNAERLFLTTRGGYMTKPLVFGVRHNDI